MLTLLHHGTLLAMVLLGAGAHIRGSWRSNGVGIDVLATFGFQKTDPTDPEGTRGFIYGNISFSGKLSSSVGYLILVRHDLYSKLKPAASNCSEVMSPVSELAFHQRCFPGNRQDLMRMLPCPTGQLCAEEDDSSNVISGHQFTFRIQDTSSPKFWYLLLTGCTLDANCNWTLSRETVPISIDVWLVNGHPDRRGLNPFEHQFSFEQMDTAELYLITAGLFVSLTAGQLVAQTKAIHAPCKMLLLLLSLRTCASFINCWYCVQYAVYGSASPVLKLIAELLLANAEVGFTVLLIGLVKGWPVCPRTFKIRRRYFVLACSACLFQSAFICFLAADNVYSIAVHKLETWPGWLSMLLRLLFLLCFMVELRTALVRETRSHRATFLMHFGSAYMVWFVHVFVLVSVARQVSVLWRYKLLIGISSFTDFLSYVGLVHLFFPRGGGRSIFFDQNAAPGSPAVDDWDEFERSMIAVDAR